MNRYVATSLLATSTGMVLVFAVHGCSLNPYADYSREEAKAQLTGSSSATSSGGGASSTTSSSSGNPNCKCVADDNPCTTDRDVGTLCPGADEISCHTPAPATECTDGNGMPAFCDTAGMCTPCNASAEVGTVHRCQGQPCGDNGECANGKCVDGYCCDSDCTLKCDACNRVPGTCTPLPVGMPGECPMGALCGNNISCNSPAKVALGGPCASAVDCESGACVGQLCVSLDGQPCVEHLECASRLCDAATNTCIPCSLAAPCPDTGTCGNGTCQALLGQPAKTSSECQSPGMVHDGLTCTLPVGATCAENFKCIYHDCNGAPNGVCAGACQFDANCPMGTLCNKDKGWCQLPPGSLCVIDDQCQGSMNLLVGVCTGFPRRCQ